MSDVDSSSSDGEDVATTGLVATRARRSNAGTLLAGLLANVDNNPELQAAFAEGTEEGNEEDAASWQGSNASDEELEDSENDEDAGPPVEGEEDLAGEKELRKVERKEQVKKRKAKDAKLKLPAWQKKTKRVKLADDAKTEDGASTPSTAPKPKKKSERSNWLPTAADAPTRQSARASAVQMREITHANLKESAAKSEKQRDMMKRAAAREEAKKNRVQLTQEQRYEACKRIEKETARELGRYEREEAERQRLREEFLASKRKRGLDGAFIRHWSGSGMYEGYGESWKLKVKRIQSGKQMIEEVEALEKDREKKASFDAEAKEDKMDSNAADEASKTPLLTLPSIAAHSRPVWILEAVDAPKSPEPGPAVKPQDQIISGNGFLDGIESYASTPDPLPAAPNLAPDTKQNSPAAQVTPVARPPQQPQSQPFHYSPPLAPFSQSSATSSQGQSNWPPGASMFSASSTGKAPQPPAAPPPPPQPVLREQAQRSLVMLEGFTNLEAPTERKKYARKSLIEADDTALRRVLLPYDTHPSMSPEHFKYLTNTKIFRGVRVASSSLPPAKPKCAISMFNAKYKDPKTGMAYSDVHAYKTIQRVVAGGVMWSGVLGAWCGPVYGRMGRAARGVPPGFTESATAAAASKAKRGEQDAVKAEEGAA